MMRRCISIGKEVRDGIRMLNVVQRPEARILVDKSYSVRLGYWTQILESEYGQSGLGISWPALLANYATCAMTTS